MKYKRLSNKELQSLQPDFIKFLASNTITAADWEKIKNTNQQQAEQLIEHFSDLITERVLENATYLEFFSHHQAQAIYCTQKEMLLLGLYVPQGSKIDFTAFSGVKELLEVALKSTEVEIIKGKKKFQKNRNQEIFAEIQKGFKIVKKSPLFEGLKLLIK